MVIVSYFVGLRFYPIKYETGKIVLYIALAVTLLFISMLLEGENKFLNATLDTILLLIFFAVTEIRDKFFTLLFKKGQ
jgi:hypothetical protein